MRARASSTTGSSTWWIASWRYTGTPAPTSPRRTAGGTCRWSASPRRARSRRSVCRPRPFPSPRCSRSRHGRMRHRRSSGVANPIRPSVFPSVARVVLVWDVMGFNPREVARVGRKVYERHRADLERRHRGRYVLIDVKTEKLFLAESPEAAYQQAARSEERRVGKELRSRVETE